MLEKVLENRILSEHDQRETFKPVELAHNKRTKRRTREKDRGQLVCLNSHFRTKGRDLRPSLSKEQPRTGETARSGGIWPDAHFIPMRVRDGNACRPSNEEGVRLAGKSGQSEEGLKEVAIILEGPKKKESVPGGERKGSYGQQSSDSYAEKAFRPSSGRIGFPIETTKERGESEES